MNRSNFLGAAAATVVVAGPGGAMTRAALASGDGSDIIGYDAFLARVRAPFKHKQLFTSPRVNSGAIFAFMRNSLNGYQFGWSEGPGTLHAVAVLNGLGVAQGVNDAAWTTYRIGSMLALNGDPVKTAGAEHGNPWLHAVTAFPRDDADANAPFNRDASIETLQRRDATIFVCNNALRELAHKTVEAGYAGGLDLDAMHATLRRSLVAGAVLVPAGVTTIDALQQEHFTLYDASV